MDGGCNATVCGSEWLARATENYATIGYDVLKVSDEGRPFKGLSGMTNTKGSFRIPFALTFEDPKQKQPGVMDTHVIDDKVPLLLSQYALLKRLEGVERQETPPELERTQVAGCQVWEILQPTLPWLQMLHQA